MMKQLNIRVDENEIKKLEFVCKFYGLSKTDFILSAINLEYDKLNNNEQVLDIMDKFKELSKELANLTGYQVIDNK